MAIDDLDDVTGTGQDSNNKFVKLRSVKISTWVFLLVWLGLLLLYNVDWPTGLIGVGVILLIEIFTFWCRDMEVKWYGVAVGIGLIATGMAKLVWPAFPWLTRWMVFVFMVILLLLIYLLGKRLLKRAQISEMAVPTMKYIIFALLLVFLPLPPKHDMAKVYEVYYAIKDDVVIFQDYEILWRGGGINVIHTTGGKVPNFERNNASPYKYSLVDRDRFMSKSPEFYKEFGFSDEHSFMVHISTMLGIFEDLDLFYVYARRRLDIPGLITIAVTHNDDLYYYPDSLQIPNDLYEYALKRGELSKLSGNWYYVKEEIP